MRFLLDGTLHRSENFAPWDFNGGNDASCVFYDFGQLAAGEHTIRVEWGGGEDSATFTRGAGAPQPPPPSPEFDETVYASGVGTPTAMDFAPDGRLFVAQKNGQLRVVSATGQLLTTPFVTVNVVTPSEKGLLGVTFDPALATNRFVYVYYTNAADGLNQVSRFTASSSNPNVAEAGSETVILDNISGSSADNHNGGAIHFGPDGKLYVAVGDNGTSSQAQQLGSLRGKILRLNANGSCPSDNPFVGTSGARCEVWATGLRNPFTFAFDPNGGAMRINDVGENTWEEVNAGVRAANYGWPACEGPQNTGVGDCSNSAYTYPIRAYEHSLGSAITGGVFYRGKTFPAEFTGAYFYSDYLGDFIRYIDAQGGDHAWRTASGPVDLKVGPDGALYYLSISDGAVKRIQAAETPSPLSPPPPPPPGDSQPPSAPSNLRVTSATTTSVGLAWTASTDDVGVAGYDLYLNGVQSWTTIGTSFTHLGLSCGTTYTFAVDAYDAAGNLSAKTQLSAATTACSPPPPPPPNTISQSISGGSTISATIRWEATTSGATPANVHFFVDGTDHYTENAAPFCFNGDATCGFDTTTLTNGSHSFRVESRTSSGGVLASDTDTATVDNSAPPSPPPSPPAPPPPGSRTVQPGQSWNSFYQSASCGEVINLAGGSHGFQEVLENPTLSNCSENVVFQAAVGASVQTGEIRFGRCSGCFATNAPDHLTIRGPMSNPQGVSCVGDCHYIVIDKMDGGAIALDSFDNPEGPKHWLVKNSDWGPCWSSGSNAQDFCNLYYGLGARQIEISGNGVDDIQFTGNTIHDFDLVQGHYECVRTSKGSNYVWRGNKFWGCEIYGLAVSEWQGISYIENNWFGGGDHGNGDPRGTAVIADPTIPGQVVIRFNSFSSLDGIMSDIGVDHGGYTIVGNLIGERQCFPNAVYAFNSYDDGGTCGPTDISGVQFSYKNGARGASMDYHLSGPSLADGFVPATAPHSDLTSDYDGQPRSAPRDAGSDER